MRGSWRGGLAGLGLGALCLVLFACAATVEGRVLLVGNEPFARLVLRLDAGGDLELSGPRLSELGRLQNRRVRLSGELTNGAVSPGLAGKLEVERIVLVNEIMN